MKIGVSCCKIRWITATISHWAAHVIKDKVQNYRKWTNCDVFGIKVANSLHRKSLKDLKCEHSHILWNAKKDAEKIKKNVNGKWFSLTWPPSNVNIFILVTATQVKNFWLRNCWLMIVVDKATNSLGILFWTTDFLLTM